MVAVTFTDTVDTGTTWTSHSTNSDAVEIPDSYLLFNAEFGRAGFDLTLTDDQGHSMRIADYFRHEQSPDLVSPDGAKLTGSVVEKLAGPQFPGQYSQVGELTGQQAIAIGQVESTTSGSTVKRADGSVEPLAEGTKVFQNDVVQTVEGGKLSITFIDGTIFTLASKSRMVLDELVYAPASTENSAVFNLIEGSFVFIAGKAAKSGGMEINTPVATLGIRGTTVKVDIETVNGVSTVDVSLNRDPDGSIGSIVLTDLSGDVIANITATDSKWVVSPVEGDTREIQRTASEISADQVIISEAVRAFTISQQRVDDGGEFVEGAEQSGQEAPAEDGEEPSETESEPELEAAPENGEQAPEGNEPAPEGGDQAPEGEQQGNLGEQGGSGLETASAADELTTIDGGGSSTTESLDGSTGQQQAAADPLAPNPTPNTPVANNSPAPDSGPAVTSPPVQNAAPVITFPSLSPSVNEDGSVALSGFSISDPEGSTLTATLTAGSTISIAPSTGVTIVSGTGTDDTQLVISGTGQQISDALNSATYKPTPNDDNGGTLTVSVTDGTNTSTQTLVVDIVPLQDAPTALDDTITRTEGSNLFFGDVTLNDSDPDITPTPDVLTVQSATDSGTPFGGGTSTGGTAVTVGTAQTLTNGGEFTIFSNGQYSFDPGSGYDYLADGETAVETIDYVINDGNGNIDDATLTINITGTNTPAIISVTNPTALTEGTQGVVTVETIDLTTLLNVIDPDGGDTPTIDPDSIVVSLNPMSTTIGGEQAFNISGTTVTVDTGIFDNLEASDVGLFDVTFDVISGPDTSTQTVTITINGEAGGTINEVTGTANAETLNGTTGNDFILGNGNANNGNEFLFGDDGDDVLVGTDEGENFNGGDGNDTIITGDSPSSKSDFVYGSNGNDRINYGGNNTGYKGVSYSALTAGIVVSIDAAANTATVDKGVNGTDTFIDIIKPLEAAELGTGGLGINGTQFNDTFNLDTGPGTWMQVNGGRGVDTFNIISGAVRLDLRTDENYNPPNNGVNVNLTTKTIIDDGFGNTESITGPGTIWEVRGSKFDDIIIGSAADESFIGSAGNDIIDGGGGFDRIRYDRPDVGSVRVYLEEGSATGFWGTDQFNHTLSNIEHVRGSNLGVDFIDGSSAGGEILDGRAGTDFLNGRGGNDTLTGGTQTDIFLMEAGSGHDTITDFELGVDGIGALGYGTTYATAVQSLTFDGTDTQVVFTGGTDSLTIEGVDLTSAAPEDIFAFVQIDGTEGDDELNGTAQNEGFFGLGGSDILHGGGGNDVLFSGSSPGGYNGEWDQLFGDAGNDILIANQDSFVRLVGGEGDDVIKVVNVSVSDDETKWYEGHVLDYSTSTSGIVANLTSGTLGPLNSGQISDGLGYVDTVDGIQQIADSDFDDIFVIDSQLINKHGANRVEVRLSEGDDSVDFTTSARGRISYRYADDAVDANLATGTAVDRDLGNGDQIGNDAFINATDLNGSRYDDLLTGDANNNILQGRQGDDILNGAGGFDTAGHWGTRSRIEVDLNNSTNQIISDGSGGSDTLIDIEQIAGSLFADGIDGSSGADNLQGYAGNDFLNGRAGNDYLSGDYDSGAAGYLGGNDFLAGGTGNDNLHGGDNADVFYFKSGDGFDYIDDFNFGDGDRIDVGEFGYTNTGDFTQFTFNGTDTFVEFDSGTTVTVANVDLTSLVNPNEAFIFNVTNGWVGSSTIGTSGDDHIRPISDNGNNFITATAGDDIIDYTFAQEMFQQLSYSGNTLATDITVTIDAVANNGNGTVVKGGGVGTDTLFNVLNPLQSGYHSNGGFHIFGTIGDDEFFLDAGEVSWMNVSGLDGNDTFDIDSGLVRLSYSSAFTGISANLATGTITDGLGGTDTVSGAQGAWEIQGSDFVDTFTGSANDESFITRAGDDIVDGGAGFDRVRYDRPGIGSDAIDANLQTGTVTGQWNGIAFTDTISNIEAVRGGSGNDTITGTTAAEKFQGQDGNDTIIGGGGEDNLYGDGGNDTIVVTDGNYYRADGGDGQDTLVVEGGGQQIDFTLSDAPETWNFENFDLGTGDGSTEVTANEQNVLDVTDEANTAIAAVLGNGDSALLVDGDASDIVNLESSGDISGGSWILDSGDSTTYSGYDVYHYTDSSSTFARIVIDEDIQVVVA